LTQWIHSCVLLRFSLFNEALLTDEYGRTRKTMVVVYLKALRQHLLEGTEGKISVVS
jgi:hypothetical protein